MAISYSTTVNTTLTTSASQAVTRWEARLIRDVYSKGFWTKFMGKSGDNFAGEEYAIHVDENFVKSPGDSMNFDLGVALSGSGVTGANQLTDHEEAMTFAQENVKVDRIRHAVRSGGMMTLQRAAFYKSAGGDGADKFRMDAKNRLGDWWAESFMDKKIGQQLCGDTTQTFANTAEAASSGRIICQGGGTATTDITAADQFDLSLIDTAVAKAKVRTAAGVPRIRPAKINGIPGKHYVVVMHPYQVRDMRTNTSDGQWLDVTKAAGLRGDVNRIFSGVQVNFVGYYNGCALFEHDSVVTSSTWGAGSVAGATALFLGAQAMCFAWAQYPKWVEEWKDYKEFLGVSTNAILGFQKTRFSISSTNYDLACIALNTAAAAS